MKPIIIVIRLTDGRRSIKYRVNLIASWPNTPGQTFNPLTAQQAGTEFQNPLPPGVRSSEYLLRLFELRSPDIGETGTPPQYLTANCLTSTLHASYVISKLRKLDIIQPVIK